VAAAVYS